jgi:hypothetical protein
MSDHECKTVRVEHRLEEGARSGNEGTWIKDYVYGVCSCGAHLYETLSSTYVRYD